MLLFPHLYIIKPPSEHTGAGIDGRGGCDACSGCAHVKEDGRVGSAEYAGGALVAERLREAETV